MIVAGDVGGTKTLVGIFDGHLTRPRRVRVRAYPTHAHETLGSVISRFLAEEGAGMPLVSAAAFGVAGPVLGDTATLTNLPFTIDATEVSRILGGARVALLNDLAAMAYSVPVLEGDELLVLQRGEAVRGGNMALVAAGTGLGQALLHNVDGRFVPSPSEGGHADWAPRTELDITVLRWLRERFGRAEVEQVVSGRGLSHLHQALHLTPCPVVPDPEGRGAPAAISRAALERRCERCVETLEVFVEAYGAEAGNAALRAVATGGLFVGGGIAPKIVPALTDGRFMRAFIDKGPMRELLAGVPVRVILNAEAGLLGAAVCAAAL
jgi:glucokinase